MAVAKYAVAFFARMSATVLVIAKCEIDKSRPLKRSLHKQLDVIISKQAIECYNLQACINVGTIHNKYLRRFLLTCKSKSTVHGKWAIHVVKFISLRPKKQNRLVFHS
ncbi:hypothetical protein AMTR_s00176p00015100 [Amborella trichopoda]|uniref:Uncharacterized protein n=1 Tax=Amborella trichopoda TaxID=13333 RepID=W1PUH9_AMBTC|nr:hypothetical protein AMTR_s00176p00015100 [Amborella trichopoda]